MSKNNLNFIQKVILEISWAAMVLFSLLPHFVKYRMVAPLLYLLIYRVVGYRVKVVRENLQNSFPDYTAEQLRTIERGFYRVLSEIIVSTISQATTTIPKELIFAQEAEAVRQELGDQNWIALTSHFGLWEFQTYFAKYCGQSAVAVYHPLENRVSDELFKRLRGKDFVVTVPLRETVKFALEHRDGVLGRKFALGLLADQNPPRRPNSVWYQFMGRETIFFDGGEKIARKLSMPVYFAYQQRIAPGRYLFRADLLHDGKEQVEPGEVTRRYIARLEQEIRRTPEMWLWSHRRWKHKREA